MSEVKEIDIRQQRPLGFARTFNITVNGIRYRLFRSSVTLVVVAVAVAFVMNILVESVMKMRLAETASERLREYRVAALWTSRLTSPPSLRALLAVAAHSEDNAPQLVELVRFGRLTGEDLASLRRGAAMGEELVVFLEQTDYGRLRLLTSGRRGIAALDHLAKGEALATFRQQLAGMRSVRSPLNDTELDAWAAQWPRVRAHLEAAREGHSAAIRDLRTRLGRRPLVEVLAGAADQDGELIRAAGFEMDDAEAARVAAAAKVELLAAELDRVMEDDELRRQAAARLDLLPVEVTPGTLWPTLATQEGATWFAGLMGADPEQLRLLAKQRLDERRMQTLEPLGADLGGGLLGMGQRTTWLIGLSLVVCTVGIANAMLMSVTERYREIATFKCLGALDGSIMLIFIIEAALIGSVGGLLGAIVGGVLGALGGMLAYGTLVFAVLPVGALAASAMFSVLIGVTLAAAASVYPSQKAARLPPMEAMRIE